MKSAIGLQFLTVARRTARAGAWLVLSMAVGLILVILFGRPDPASTSFAPASPAGHQNIKSKTGPWAYGSLSTRV